MKISKRLFIAGLFLVLLIPFVSAQYQGTFSQIVNVSLINQLPDPVQPGEVVELSFRLENLGEELARNVEVEILPEYPFSLRPGESAAKSVGTIESLQKGDDGVVARFKMIVDPNAPDDDHEIRVRHRSAGSQSWAKSQPFLIKVLSSNAILGVEQVTTDPEIVAPGSIAKTSITMKNYAGSLLRDIVVRLNLQDTPFNPVGSSNERVIEDLSSKQQGTATFEFVVDPDADADVYQVPATISYRDAQLNNFTKENVLSIIIGDTPDISLTLDSTTIYTSKSSGEITVRFVNKGTSDIKFLTITINEHSDYEIIGTRESYIGNLDSDDFSTAEFSLYVDEKEGIIDIPIVAEYKDANNKNYVKTLELPLQIYSTSKAAKIGLVEKPSYTFPLLLLLGGAGYWYYRKRKKK